MPRTTKTSTPTVIPLAGTADHGTVTAINTSGTEIKAGSFVAVDPRTRVIDLEPVDRAQVAALGDVLTPSPRDVADVEADLVAAHARIAELEARLAAATKAPDVDPRPVATWIGNELRTPKGSIIGRVNRAAPVWSGGLARWAPIYHLSPDSERLGPEGTREEAARWVSVFAGGQGWKVVG